MAVPTAVGNWADREHELPSDMLLHLPRPTAGGPRPPVGRVVLRQVSPVTTLTSLIEVSGLLAELRRGAVRCAGPGGGGTGAGLLKITMCTRGMSGRRSRGRGGPAPEEWARRASFTLVWSRETAQVSADTSYLGLICCTYNGLV